jgi:hypothetical protein
MLSIGLNSQILASKTNVNNAVGTKVANLLRAIRELNDLKQMFAQYTDAELKALGFGDGTEGTDNEIGYGIRDPLLCGEDLFKLLHGQTPTMAANTDYSAKLAYVAGGQG